MKRDRRFVEIRSIFYAAQVCLALDYLHSNNLIYRDLTPENILMGDDGYICLSELENISNIDENVESETFTGSPEYIGNLLCHL